MRALAQGLRKVGVGADIGMTVALQVIGAVAAFAFQVMFLRELTKADSGLYYLAISYITIGSGLADFGLVATVFPRLSVARGRVTASFKAALVIRSAMLGVSLLVLNLYMVAFAKWELLPLVNIAFISVVINSKATGLRQIFEVLWRLRGRTYVTTLVSVVDALLALGALAVLAWADKLTVGWLVAIFTFSSLPGCIVIVAPLVKLIRESGVMRRRIPWRFYRALALASLPVALMVVLAQTSAQLETLVIESYTAMTHADIAAYNAAVKPLTALIFVATTLGFGLAPLVAQQARGMRSDYSLEFITSLGLRLIGAIALAICLVCGLFAEPIMRLFGEQYVHEAYILRIFSGISALTFIVVMMEQFLLALGRRKQALYGAVLNLALALATEPITIRLWGIRGMMYSKAFAMSCLIAFQISRMPAGARAAAARALLRLVPSAAALTAALLLTEGDGLAVRTAAASAAFALPLVLFRTLRVSELKALRAMRVA